jgi:hypothetical protein
LTNLVGLRRVIKISHTVLNGTSLPNLDGFAPTRRWVGAVRPFRPQMRAAGGGVMTCNCAEIIPYLTRPRRNRYRYLDGCKE